MAVIFNRVEQGALGAILDRALEPLFWHAQRLGTVSSWWTHVPFAHWLVHETRPRILVELGTHNGVSYSAFCEAVLRAGSATRCHAVDTWRGDAQAGEYGEEVYEEFRRFHDERFGAFSTLMRRTFDEALETISDGSVDLLHVDGLHTFEAVRHDVQGWFRKLSNRAVVLFHDTNERRDDFGVWRVWEDLRERYPSFEFLHGHGLGILAVGEHPPKAVVDLCALSDPSDVASLRERFALLGERWSIAARNTLFEREARHQIDAAVTGAEEARTQVEQARAEAQTQVEQIRAEARMQIEQAHAEARTQVEQVRAEARMQIEQACHEMRVQVEQTHAESESSVNAIRRDAHDRVVSAEARSESLAEAARLAAHHATMAEAAASANAFRAASIEGSTIWRATRPLRWTLERLPRTRRFARRVLHAGRLIARIQLPRRLRERLATPVPIRPDAYAQWVRVCDTLNDADRDAIRAHIAELAWRPLISIVVPVYNTRERHLREMIESVRLQSYPHWELCLADDASTELHVKRTIQEYAALDSRIKCVTRKTNGHICAATNSAIDLATGEFVALLDHDDLLSERALYEIAVELNVHPEADVIYSDSDNIDDAGHRWGPYFKTDWDPDLMLGHNMVSHLGVYRRSLLEQIGRLRLGYEGSQDYDLMLRAADVTTPDRIRHVPAVLYHWRREAASPSFSESSLARCVDAARRAIGSHLERRGIHARVEPAPMTLSFTRVVYALPKERPLVSLIVPIRDKQDLLARCADGVLARTDYEPLELIIVDNDSKEADTLSLLSRLTQDPRVRIVRYPGAFNFAAMNNCAVREARGEVVVLLNNDVDVISSQWLEEMVAHALRPEVGAVGAKLLYADGRVQHAGVILGVGHGAGHFFHMASAKEPGYFGFLALTRRVSAVTAACMALRRSIYLEVGGMDEVNLPVAFNDVDLCLRIGERGYAVVWTPHAQLYHFESATRGVDADGDRAARLQRDAEYLRQRWGAVLDNDPHYNPNCSLSTAYFEPAFPPRRQKTWLSFKKPAVNPPAAMSRVEMLLGNLDRSARIVEVGPSYNPIAPKGNGWNTITVDHATRGELIEKYRGHPGVEVNQIEEVDFVWTTGSIADAVPSDLHGTFDALIASHVIEHTTDLVGFLDAAATLLAESGIVILAVPDKRYCFDYFRPLATTGDVLDAHTSRRSRHTRRQVFNHHAYVVTNGGAIAWGQSPVREFCFSHSIEEAAAMCASVSEDPASPYVDTHAWQFTPASFELLLLELARLRETDWLVDRITPATGCEFFAWLRRGGKAAAAALSTAEFDARRLMLLKNTLFQTREQVDFLACADAARPFGST
jgi:O-antigen biosynthesis protein